MTHDTHPSNPKDKLLFDEDDHEEQALNDANLYERLAPFVQIGRSTGRIQTTDTFDQLKMRQQVTAIVLAQFAKDTLGLLDHDEVNAIPPREIANLVEMSVVQVYPVLQKLERDGILFCEGRKYSVLPEDLTDAVNVLPAPHDPPEV